jgi:LDH2 family malate/lactate/ureidoglycolate dehydrogenase
METYISEIKNEPKGPGVDEILIPGELEHRCTIQRKRDGIELPLKVAQELMTIGKRYSVELAKAALDNNEEVRQCN